jgi:Ca2+-transporting ATPase
MGGTLLLLGLVLYVPGLRNLFKFSMLSWVDLLIAFAAGVLSIAWFEVLKLIWGRRGP